MEMIQGGKGKLQPTNVVYIRLDMKSQVILN